MRPKVFWAVFMMFFAGLAMAAPVVSLRENVEAGWQSLMATWYPKTGLLYGVDASRVQPAKDFTNGILVWSKGSKFGYGRGMGDCAIISGVALSMLCDQYQVTKDAAVKEEAAKVAFGLLNLARSHGFKGFVARGLCAEDGKSVCNISSRDQVTHWVHGLWRYSRSGLMDAKTRAEYTRLVVEVAERMLRNVTPENEYNFLQADGTIDPRGICTMWGPKIYPHEAARLPMIYLAAWKMSGDLKWRDLYEKYIDEAIARTLVIKSKPPRVWAGIMPTYSLFQMNTSLELILDVEQNPARRAKIEEAMRYTAGMAHDRAMGVLANPKRQPYGLCVPGEILLTELMAPGYVLDPRDRIYLEKSLSGRIARTGGFNTSHLPAVYWRARVKGVLQN